jgi:hypothetical protein
MCLRGPWLITRRLIIFSSTGLGCFPVPIFLEDSDNGHMHCINKLKCPDGLCMTVTAQLFVHVCTVWLVPVVLPGYYPLQRTSYGAQHYNY